MKNKVGRPKMKLNEAVLQRELKKYIEGKQSAVTTYST